MSMENPRRDSSGATITSVLGILVFPQLLPVHHLIYQTRILFRHRHFYLNRSPATTKRRKRITMAGSYYVHVVMVMDLLLLLKLSTSKVDEIHTPLMSRDFA